MGQRSAISIPESLLPSDGRFGSGPSKIDTKHVEALAATGSTLLGTSHRRPTVKNLVGGIREKLNALYDTPDGYEVILGIGGATAFWDAAAFGLIKKRSGHFVCGEFSQKFAAVSAGAPFLSDPIIIDAAPGDAPDPEPIEDVDAVAFVHNETSTGVTAPVARLTEALVLVDGTSAAGAIPIDISQTDAYYFSPQKALGSEGGLWCSFFSPSAIERARAVAVTDRWIPPFLSLTTAIDNSILDQTYNTPAITTLFLLDQQLDMFLAHGGLTWSAERSRTSSSRLYDWAEASNIATPFVRRPERRSTTVVTIDFVDSVDADKLSDTLRSNGIVDTESYRKLGRNQLRIATFPSIEPADVTSLTQCIDHVAERLAD
jgi:phosphoserine aminotransferase